MVENAAELAFITTMLAMFQGVAAREEAFKKEPHRIDGGFEVYLVICITGIAVTGLGKV